MLILKIIDNVQRARTAFIYFYAYFHLQLMLFQLFQLIYQLTFFYIYNFHSLNILQHHKIFFFFFAFAFTTTWIPNKSFIAYIVVNNIGIYFHSTFPYYYKQLHQVCLCICMFHSILCVLLH